MSSCFFSMSVVLCCKVFRVEFKSSVLLVIALLPSLIAAIISAELYSRSVPSPCSDMAGSVALACLLAVVVAAPDCLLPVIFLVLDMYEDENPSLLASGSRFYFRLSVHMNRCFNQ